MRRRLLLTLPLTAALAFAAPAVAHASTLTRTGTTLAFVAAAGKTNAVVFSETMFATVTVSRDLGLGDNDPIATVTGCTQVIAQVEYTCPTVSQVVADAGNGNDSLKAVGLVNVSATLSGADGADTLTGGARDDTLDGGADVDTLTGGAGDDTLTGDAGVDTLTGGAGDDSLDGGTESDTLDGGDDDDTLSGGEGDDTLHGGDGADVINGGGGIDTAVFDGTAAKLVSLNGVADDGADGEGDNVQSGVEDVRASAAAAATVTLTGDAGGNSLTVTAGKAVITGGDGSDALTGGPQDDVIHARDGFSDRVVCGAGADLAVVDELDTVSESCETVQVESVPGGADDRPPAVAWTAPAAGAALPAGLTTTLTATASDDRGIAKVQFFDDDRLLCEDTSAPYTCNYVPRGEDVGRDTLLVKAIDGADQSATATRTVTVGHFAARSLTLTLAPARDRFAPFVYKLAGKLTLPATVGRSLGCAGNVTITVRAAGRTVAIARPKLSHFCEYRATITLRTRPASRLTLLARFDGNAAIAAIAARSKHARTT